MLARVAESLFWLSRYLERAENTVRLIRQHSNLLMDLPAIGDHEGWIPLISINGLDEEFNELYASASETNVNHFLLADLNNSSSLINAFKAISINLRSCRDILPKASYESINSLCRFVIKQIEDAHQFPAQRQAFLGSVEERLLAIAGSLNGSMSHDLGYLMMRMGCHLERGDMTSRIIDVQSTRMIESGAKQSTTVVEAQRWVSVLRSLAAHQMYRQHVRRPVNGPDTLTFLLKDKHLPRSYACCLYQLDNSLAQLSNNESSRAAVAALLRQLNAAPLADLATDPVQLHEYLDNLQLGMLKVSAAISATYLPPKQETE